LPAGQASLEEARTEASKLLEEKVELTEALDGQVQAAKHLQVHVPLAWSAS